MDNSAVQSQGSISSISTSTLTVDPHGTSSQNTPSEFVNPGLLLWNQTRLQWIGNKKSENQAQQLREPKLSWNATYESLLGSNKPFRRPIPLPEMVDFLVDIWEQDGLGDALLQATQNINKLFQNLTPSGLIGRVKEHDECYKLRFNLPGLGKEALKITVEDGVLTIKGEHKEEVEEGSDDEQYLSARSFGYFIDTCIVLPEDAKVDEIKAQMKDGVLTIIIPRIEKPKKEVKEVPIH